MKSSLAGMLLLLLISVAGTASDMSLDKVTDWGNGINSVQTITMLTTSPVSGAQYICYIDKDLQAVVARRPPGTSWEDATSTVVGTVTNDAHNTCAIGVDSVGYVHVAWDLHDAATFSGHTAISAAPDSIAEFAPEAIGGVAVSGLSYPVFYRGGPAFYLLFRCGGISGSADTCVKRYTYASGVGTWSDVAIPLISGASQIPPDSSYLGNAIATSSGDLHIVWTTRITPQNRGVHYARYDAASSAWMRSDGSAYVLPITRFTAENVLGDNLADTSLQNSGLSLTVDASGAVYAGYSRSVAGHREVFVARRAALGWDKSQVSRVTAVRLAICELASDPDPGPCDLEVMGPLLVSQGATVTALYALAVAAPPTSVSWLRPAGKLYAASSSDGGRTWRTFHIEQPLDILSGEMSRDTSGAASIVYQTVNAESGPLYIGAVDGIASLPSPAFSASGTFPVNGRFIEIPDSSSWDHPTGGTLAVLVRPALTNRPMALVHAEGAGLREMRLMIWTCAHHPVTGVSVYDQGCAQVVLGNTSGGLGLVWYPAVSIPQGELTHVAVTWDGAIAKIYINGYLSAQTPYASQVFNGTMSRTLGVIKGYPQYNFEGWISAEYYGSALTPAQICLLFERGENPQ